MFVQETAQMYEVVLLDTFKLFNQQTSKQMGLDLITFNIFHVASCGGKQVHVRI